MTAKKTKTVRRTVVVLATEDVPVSSRALQWESASKTARRRIHRVERATSGPWIDAGVVYLIDMELTCKGANRHDLTKFVQSYLPEVEFHYITD
jgi:regulator of sirC expression with transglutaminase-like and TPR domain